MSTRSVLWTEASTGKALGAHAFVPFQARGVCIDSRLAQRDDLFIALKGPNHDGHDYVAQAIGKGAAAAVVNADWAGGRPQDLPLLPVKDTTAALTALAAHKRLQSRAKFIGVTGSVGKTGTKESLANALSVFGDIHKTIGNLNNHTGLPLTLSRLPDGARFAILEMGMNHSGEIDALSRLSRPNVAIITTVAAVHLEFFTSIEGIADAKSEIFAGVEPNGAAVLFRDGPFYDRLVRKARAAGVSRILSFGQDTAADVRLINCSLHASCSAATVQIGKEILDYCVGVPGRHWVMNSLAVLAAVKALGEDAVAVTGSFAEMRAQKGRGAYRQIALPGGATAGLIDESYNASPASVRAAIAVLGRTTPKAGGRRIAVLGDMLELGDSGPEMHASLSKDLVAAEIDTVFCCGALMKGLWETLPPAMRGAHADRSPDLANAVAAAVRPGDVITVKGSLGSNMGAIVCALDSLNREEPAPKCAKSG